MTSCYCTRKAWAREEGYPPDEDWLPEYEENDE